MAADTTTIRVSLQLKDELEALGTKKDHFEDILRRLLDEHNKRIEEMHEAVVDQWGKASISRTKAGQTIEYRIKPKN